MGGACTPLCPPAQINSYNTKMSADSKQFPEGSVTVQEGWGKEEERGSKRGEKIGGMARRRGEKD